MDSKWKWGLLALGLGLVLGVTWIGQGQAPQDTVLTKEGVVVACTDQAIASLNHPTGVVLTNPNNLEEPALNLVQNTATWSFQLRSDASESFSAFFDCRYAASGVTVTKKFVTQ